MRVGIGAREQMLPKYLLPKNRTEELSPQQSYCLFLDMDGTLAEFTLNPKDSVIPKTTLTLLASIQNQGVNVAIVTGRSLSEAREMLAPLKLPIAATHGLEISFDDNGNSNGNLDDTKMISVDAIELVKIRQMITQFCMPYDDFFIENKPYSVALHYRRNPMLADVAQTIMSKTLENYTDWVLKSGKYVLEAIPKGADKGSAILALLKTMQSASTLCPIFIGDDITDEAGFAAVQGENAFSPCTAANPASSVMSSPIKIGQRVEADCIVFNKAKIALPLSAPFGIASKTYLPDFKTQSV